MRSEIELLKALTIKQSKYIETIERVLTVLQVRTVPLTCLGRHT